MELLAVVQQLQSFYFYDASAFEDVVLAATGFWGEDRRLLRQVASLARLQFEGALVKSRTTHLVAHSLAAAHRSEKLAKAREWGIPVVSLQWLVDSIAEGRPLPVGGAYAVVDVAAVGGVEQGRRRKEQRQQPEQERGASGRGRPHQPTQLPRPSSVASNHPVGEATQQAGAITAHEVKSPGRQALGRLENVVAGLHRLSISPKRVPAAAGGPAAGVPAGRGSSPAAMGSPQGSLSFNHLMAHAAQRSPSSSPAAVSSRLVGQGQGPGAGYAAGWSSALPQGSPMLASPLDAQQPSPGEPSHMCSSPGGSVASEPGSAPAAPSPASPSDCSMGAGSPEGSQPFGVGQAGGALAASLAGGMELGAQAQDWGAGWEAEQRSPGAGGASCSPRCQQAQQTDSEEELLYDDRRPAGKCSPAGMHAWGSPDLPAASPAPSSGMGAPGLYGKGHLPSPANFFAEQQLQHRSPGNDQLAGDCTSPSVPSDAEASPQGDGGAQAAAGRPGASPPRQLHPSNQPASAQQQPKKQGKGIQDWTDDDSEDDFPTPLDPHKGRPADQGFEPVVIARPPPAVPSLKGDAVALKLLQRAPRGNCVREHHRLKTLKQVQFAEQVQVKGAKLVLSTKDKKTAIKLRSQPAGDDGEDEEDDFQCSGASLHEDPLLGEVATFYKLPDDEWYVEYYQLYTAQQAEQLAEERGVRLVLPPGYDRTNELLKSTARQCAPLADVQGAVTVRRVKQGGTLLKLKGGSEAAASRSYFCRASLALDPATMRLVTDAPVTEFVAAE